jgi:uncharacterized SAM-binding protein YcdF (DUF218 family)
MSSFVILKFLEALVLPPASLVVGVVLAILLGLRGWRKLSRLAIGLPVVQTIVLSVAPVSDALIAPLEAQALQAADVAPGCCYDAIAVLGGAIIPAYPPYRDFPGLTEASDRLWLTARLFHRGLARRIIVSGGSFLSQRNGAATTEAEAMRLFLVDLGVPPDAIVSEGASLNTIENIRNIQALVSGGRVALVTSAVHMPRAVRLAAQARLDVGAFPTGYSAVPATRDPWSLWLPSLGSLSVSLGALHELVALALDPRGSALEQ